MNGGDWRPTARADVLARRARWLAEIRAFFADRHVLEVQTPVLAAAGVTDVHIDGMREAGTGRWLQTSPEYAMKRLLAAGVGDCYQIAPAFRDGEQGRWHNPEFTLLEWYRLGFDAPALMDEVSMLVDRILGPGHYHRGSYQGFFLAAGLPDPLTATEDALQKAAAKAPIPPPGGLDRSGLLDWLFSETVVPALPPRAFVTGFPAEQAVLARREAADPRVAARFELFCNGVELANGFDELTDPVELRGRLERDQQQRRTAERTVPVIDERLLAAMAHGLPACAGVALGLDRLFALAAGVDSIAEVMAFDWPHA